MRFFMGVVAAALVGVTAPHAAKGAALGDVADAISFKDVWYLERTLDDFGEDAAAYAFAFTVVGETDSESMLTTLRDLNAAHGGAGLISAAMNVGPHDTINAVAAQALDLDAPYAFLKDMGAEAAAALGVTRTPTAVVLDADRRIRYRGPEAGMRAAVEAVLAGEEVIAPAHAGEWGQPIKSWEVPEPDAAVTYAHDIAPIMINHCVECHRPEAASPFSLMTYNQVSSRADMIEEVVREGRMPPWYADARHGQFMNDSRLSARERTLIAQWIRGGKAPGDLDAAPEPPKFSADWRIGEPDLALQAEEPFTVPASGIIPYEYVALPYQFPEDTWIQGIEIRPTNPSVVHHANLVYFMPGGEYDGDQNFLTGYVPGGNVVDLFGGMAMMIPKNAMLMLQIHYVTTGREQTDQIEVGFRYAKEPVTRRVYYTIVRPENEAIQIPPKDPFWRIEAERTIDRNVLGLALFSHMHVRGRSMQFIAVYPDGREEKLLSIPNFHFDWQLGYIWPPGTKQFPKGTKIRTVTHYDNSPFNPYNPDATATVTYGLQTADEMCDGYFFYLDMDETLNLQVDPDTGVARKTEVAQTP